VYSLEIEQEVYRTFKKLAKKDPKQLESTKKKIDQILNDPLQFKPSRHPLEGLWRVHVGSFVLIYEVRENLKAVRLLEYKHHDEAYL